MSLKVRLEVCCDYKKLGGYGGSDMPCQKKTEGMATIQGEKILDVVLPDGWAKRDHYDCDPDSDNDEPYQTEAFCPDHR